MVSIVPDSGLADDVEMIHRRHFALYAAGLLGARPPTHPAAGFLAKREHWRHRTHARRARCSPDIFRKRKSRYGPADLGTVRVNCSSRLSPVKDRRGNPRFAEQTHHARVRQSVGGSGPLLSGSGSGFPASQHAVAFHKATNKPVGVFGVSTDPISGFGEGRDPEGGTSRRFATGPATSAHPPHRRPALHHRSRRVLLLPRHDLARLPQGAGGEDADPRVRPRRAIRDALRDDAKAFAWLKDNRLENGKFICVIPRLRYTPYYRVNNMPRTAGDDIKDAINDRTTEKDHARLRDMIVAYVKHTGNKVMACPEMTYQVEMAKQVLVDPLPAAVKKNVVWRDTFWLPDEAASMYSMAQAVVSVECHSPLIALHNGTPRLHLRQPTDTCKGQMYRDFGAGDWLFEVDETSGDQLWSRLAAIHGFRQSEGTSKVHHEQVEKRQRRMVDAVRQACRV